MSLFVHFARGRCNWNCKLTGMCARHEESRSSSPFHKGKIDSRSPPRIDS